MSWHRHVDFVTAKACRALGFLRRNAKHFPVKTKELLYISNVTSILEYACTVWDPKSLLDIQKLERVQNLAVRFVFNDYGRFFSVSSAKNTLRWDTLQKRREVLRLKFFHKIFHSRTGIDRTQYIFSPDYVSVRRDHSLKVKEYRCRTDLFKMSFFPKTISDWNKLPEEIVSITSNDSFSSLL